MTAINLIRQSDAVYIVSDGVGCDRDGVVQFVVPKVFPLPHLRAAVAGRGNIFGLAHVAAALAMAPTYDVMKMRAAKTLREVVDLFRDINATQGAQGEAIFPSDLQIYVGGWTVAGEPDAFLMLTSETSGLPPWTVVPILDFGMFPGGEAQDDAWSFLAGRGVEDLDPRADGLKIIEAQRRYKIENQYGQSTFGIGGFAQLTTVARDRITTEILHRWPDQVGKKIVP
jgi:hypothetical protein